MAYFHPTNSHKILVLFFLEEEEKRAERCRLTMSAKHIFMFIFACAEQRTFFFFFSFSGTESHRSTAAPLDDDDDHHHLWNTESAQILSMCRFVQELG